MWPIRASVHDIFPLFMKFGGPPKGGVVLGVRTPPSGSAPVQTYIRPLPIPKQVQDFGKGGGGGLGNC